MKERRKAAHNKTLYVVFWEHRFGVDFLAAFTSKKKADKYCQDYNNKKGLANAFVIDEYKLNDRRI